MVSSDTPEGVSTPNEGPVNNIKPRHQRQTSDVSSIGSGDIVGIAETPSMERIHTRSPIRRCCIGCRQSMRSHKVLMGFTASTWGFLSSVERAVILPTLYLYLRNYWDANIANTYYGVTMAAFSFSILVMTPVYGWASYAGVRVRTLLLFANLLEIIGNLTYLFAATPFLVLIGRLISGIGASCEPPLYADITRATNRDERTGYIIVLLLTRQIGLIFGPSFTLLMDKMHYHFASFTLTVYNGPGLLMAVLWLLHSIVILMIYPTVDKYGRLVILDTNTSRCSCCDHRFWVDVSSSSGDATQSLLDNEVIEDDISANRPTIQYRATSLHSYRTYPIISLYAVTFATYFSFMSLEAALPPVADKYFGWTEVQTSYVYLTASILIIFVVIVLRILNSYYNDHILLLAGLVVMCFAYIWLTVVVYLLPEISEGPSGKNVLGASLMLFGISVHVIGLPFAFAYSESLYTKLAPISDMDRAQSIFRTVINVAFLIGPYVGGSLIHRPTFVFLSMTIISVIPTLLVMFKFSTFNVPARATDGLVEVDIENAKES